MIRYQITETELRDAIESEKPGWLARAQTRTDRFIAAGKYDESSGIWSEIKRVYMDLQHDKCAYCERQLAAGEDGGTIEHDVEHYRPKNSVPVWPTDSDDVTFTFPTGAKNSTADTSGSHITRSITARPVRSAIRRSRRITFPLPLPGAPQTTPTH